MTLFLGERTKNWWVKHLLNTIIWEEWRLSHFLLLLLSLSFESVSHFHLLHFFLLRLSFCSSFVDFHFISYAFTFVQWISIFFPLSPLPPSPRPALPNQCLQVTNTVSKINYWALRLWSWKCSKQRETKNRLQRTTITIQGRMGKTKQKRMNHVNWQTKLLNDRGWRAQAHQTLRKKSKSEIKNKAKTGGRERNKTDRKRHNHWTFALDSIYLEFFLFFAFLLSRAA